MPSPRLPLPPWGYLPRSSAWGGAEERAGAWVYSPGRAFPWVSPRLPPALPGVGEEALQSQATTLVIV